MDDHAWVSKIILDEEFSHDHLSQFIELWILLLHVVLVENVEDTIIWKLTPNGEYSAASAYKAQFFGAEASNMKSLVWKVWAPPKVKFFAWLALRKRLWTSDRLARRGWPNCGLCPLCNRVPETITHLLLGCRYTTRLWGLIKEWLGIHALDPSQWTDLSLSSWWLKMTSPSRKALASITLLASWEIWNERNARVFWNKFASPAVVFNKNKADARLWVIAGAKRLGEIMPGE